MEECSMNPQAQDGIFDYLGISCAGDQYDNERVGYVEKAKGGAEKQDFQSVNLTNGIANAVDLLKDVANEQGREKDRMRASGLPVLMSSVFEAICAVCFMSIPLDGNKLF